MKNKCHFGSRAARLALAVIATFALNTSVQAQPVPGSLWYNGDLNHVNGLANERDSSLGFGQFAHVWDDFNVFDAGGWNVTALYSNNYNNMTGITGVEWAIRQRITPGNGGTLVASGTETTNFSITVHYNGDFGFTEFTIQVFGLNLHLNQLLTGPYWLNVTPIGSGNGRSFTSDTSGTVCTGTPCGNNGNAFFDSNFFGANFQSTANQGQPGDFSMGVVGTVVPEPATWAMLAGGLAILGTLCRRRTAWMLQSKNKPRAELQ